MVFGSKIPAFTFPEALVTMGLLVVFAALVGGVFFQGSSMADRMDKHDRFLQEKVSLATYLPALCQEIQPPEWVTGDQVFTETPQGLSVKFWDSDAKQTLNLQIVNGVLNIQSPRGTWSWKTLSPMTVAYWKTSDRIIGLVVGWTEGTQTKTLHLAWGGRPL